METDELEGLYGEAVLDHCRNPRNHAKLEQADIVADGVNPFCGDEVHLQLRLDDTGRVAAVGLQGVGCSINRASGSMMAEIVSGRSLQQLESVHGAFRAIFEDDPAKPPSVLPGDLQRLAAVKLFPVRVKCAMLAWSTLEEGFERYRRRQQRG